MALLKVDQLKVHFPIHGGFFGRVLDHVHAVDDVSFEVQAGKLTASSGNPAAVNQRQETPLCG